MTTNKTETTEKNGDSVLAVSLNTEFRGFMKDLAGKEGKSEAHLARLAIASFLETKGYKVPEVVEAKKGPKAGTNASKDAQKFGLSNAEFSKRVTHFLTHGGDMNKMKSTDWATYEIPHTPRAPKVAEAGASEQA